MKKYKAVILDLDGTLIDSSPGIYNGLDYMLPKMGLETLTPEEKVKFIGPALSDSYSKYLGLSGERLSKAVETYRDYCRQQGYREFEHYPGMRETLKTLKDKGILSFVATMKKQSIADQTVSASGLRPLLTEVVGNNDLESIPKAEIIKDILERYDIRPEEALLIGDTDVDAAGAAGADVDYYPALFGFGYSHAGFESPYPYKHKLKQPLDLLEYIQ